MNYSEERMKESIEDNEMKLFDLVLPPSIVDLNLKLFYHRPEEKFHRKSFDFQMDLDQMSLFINSQQFSDLLDFIKFQNYSTLYGSFIHSFLVHPFSSSSSRTLSTISRFVSQRISRSSTIN